jgi:hypothetical protein
MVAAAGDPEPVVFGADAGRLVDGHCSATGQVERQVQERIDVAAFRTASRDRHGLLGASSTVWYSGCSATIDAAIVSSPDSG